MDELPPDGLKVFREVGGTILRAEGAGEILTHCFWEGGKEFEEKQRREHRAHSFLFPHVFFLALPVECEELQE